MTLAGWIFLLASNLFVIGLLAFCFYKCFSSAQSADSIHSPLDIDTRDEEK